MVLEDVAPARTPARVRISLQGQGFVPNPGQVILLTAFLSAPDGPSEPGGFDFRRMAFFRQLGAGMSDHVIGLSRETHHQRRALCAWVESGDYVAQSDGDLPSVSEYEERLAGEWESFDDYAHDNAESIGLLNEAPEELARYFNWKSWISDLAMEYTTADAPGNGVYVFRSL